ncbi:MAG: hydroxyacid dehydrogenase [Spirochaetaceae bacterium]|nr:hydroxyacid dehydrogenase [Spirochaetaceae bacterium]
MKKVLIDRPLHKDAFELLVKHVEVIEIYNDDKTEIDKALKFVDGVICSAVLKMKKYEISISDNLKVIGRPGVGYDSVDVEVSSSKGIPLVYTPDGPTESVAEHVIALMLMCTKNINTVQKALKEEGDFSIRTRVTGIEVQGKTIGLVGFGRIGQRVAEIASLGLGMKVVTFDPYIKKENITLKHYTLLDTLNELLERSDVVSLHIPLIEATSNLIGTEEFRKMKSSAFLINTARGGVVDENALIDAIQNKEIAGAGLDVYAQEPPEKNNKLFSYENVIATPHLSSFTSDGKRKMGIGVVQGVLDVLAGKKPEFMVNGEIWDKRRI